MATGIMRAIPLARQRGETKSLRIPMIFIVALGVAGLVSLLYLAQTSTVATVGYDIKRLEDQRARWQMKNAQSRVKIAELQSIDRIERDAKSRLNMAPPTKIIFVPVELSAKTTVGSEAASSQARAEADAGAKRTPKESSR
ncbi:MAG: hypothetical protein M1343_03185 [Chloroflexi bacterium]|nr:hypothetical protein [Chloroflexota bacterium]MDA8188669.1 hypothetical protein [Dehalococcoidales bacterium]